MKRRILMGRSVVVTGLLIVMTAGIVGAQPQSPNFTMTAQTFSAAATFDSSGHYTLFSSVGQWSPADTHRSANYMVTSGFLTPNYGSATGAFLTANPTVLNFGNVHTDSVSALTLTLSDTGYWNVQVNEMTLRLSTVFQFASELHLPDTIYARCSRDYLIQFQPTTATTYRDTLIIGHDDGDSIVVPLEGIGIAPAITITPDSLPFGDLWTSSFAQDSFWVHNPGSADLHVTEITSDNPVVPSIPIPFTVPSGGSHGVACEVSVPDTLNYRAILTVHSDAGEPTLPVIAHGIWTELSANPADVLLEGVMIADTIDTVITLFSIGNTYLTIDTVRLHTPQYTILVSPSDTVGAYDSTQVTLRFTTETAGIFIDTLVIEHSAGFPLRIPLAAGATVIEDNASLIPKDFFLNQNFPNPFNPATQIRFGLPHSALIVIDVYDVLGRRMATLVSNWMQPGVHSIIWSCPDCSSGMYFVRMHTENRVFIHKMLLIK